MAFQQVKLPELLPHFILPNVLAPSSCTCNFQNVSRHLSRPHPALSCLGCTQQFLQPFYMWHTFRPLTIQLFSFGHSHFVNASPDVWQSSVNQNPGFGTVSAWEEVGLFTPFCLWFVGAGMAGRRLCLSATIYICPLKLNFSFACLHLLDPDSSTWWNSYSFQL